jgi:FADH2 O2-dependent halogenase
MEPVVIVGGGPAGSALGCYLSRAGIPNLIFEGAVHPRPHVGESLVPSTTRVFQEIGFLETMEREGFVRKYGASWHPPRSRATQAIEFREFPQEGIDQDYTYHVDRGRFDLLLFKHAERLGSKVYQGVRVREVLFEDGWARGVRLEVAGREVAVPARVVVDATGRSCLLGVQLGWKKNDRLFNQFAVHAWFEGVDRGERPDDIHIHFLPVERGWVWQIPITATVTSMGVVAEKCVFQESRHDYAGWFDRLSGSAPDIARAMRDARRVNEFKVEGDYSYAMDRFVGNGFLLVGDAARFVDPIFSSGVSVALYSAKFAAERIRHAVATGDFGAEAFRTYEERLRRGTSVWYEFIRLYYKLLPLFTQFIQSPTYRHQVLQLLQGDVYDRRDVPVLDAMRKYIAAVEETQGHLLRAHLDPDIPLDLMSEPG